MSITPQDVGSFFLTLIVPIITGGAAAAITAFLALNRFYREKWWEKKHAAYGSLVDILIEMKAIYVAASIHHEGIYQAEQTLSEIPDYDFDWVRFRELKRQLKRSFILAPISLSENTEKLLTEFFSLDATSDEMIHEDGYPEQVAYSEMAGEVENLISLIVDDAKVELKFK